MASLVIAEHDNKTLKDATAKVVTAAGQVGGPVHVLVAGQGCDAVADAASKIAGVEKVLVADDALYAKMVAETMETLILSLADKYDAILAPASRRRRCPLLHHPGRRPVLQRNVSTRDLLAHRHARFVDWQRRFAGMDLSCDCCLHRIPLGET